MGTLTTAQLTFQSRRAGDHPCNLAEIPSGFLSLTSFNPDVRETIRATAGDNSSSWDSGSWEGDGFNPDVRETIRATEDCELKIKMLKQFQSRRAGDHPCNMLLIPIMILQI